MKLFTKNLFAVMVILLLAASFARAQVIVTNTNSYQTVEHMKLALVLQPRRKQLWHRQARFEDYTRLMKPHLQPKQIKI